MEPTSRNHPLAADLDHILAHTADLWESARGKRIFITGGTGFFGRWLLESFAHANRELNLGASAVVLSRNPDAFAVKAPHLAKDAAVEWMAGDVRTLSPQMANGAQFEFVIHAATEASAKLNAEDPLRMLDTIV